MTGVILSSSLPVGAAYTESAEGARVAVATDHPLATKAALETLQAGGNAFDAAIAAATTLGVVHPVASGLGGGGFALVYFAKEKKVTALDFREVAPAHLVADELMPRLLAKWPPDPALDAKRGVSVGVPGEPAALDWLHRFAKRSLAEDVAQASAYATNGFPLGRHTADWVLRMRDRLKVSPDLMSTLLPGGVALGYRDVVKRPSLGRTLSRIGAEGAKIFYAGEIAARIVEATKAAGGALDAADLARYEVRERAPLSRVFGGKTVMTMPAPSAGGLMLLEELSMFGASGDSELKALGFGSSAYLHTIAEAMRGAYADRARIAGDPDLDPGVLAAYERALEADQMTARRKRIDPNKTHTPSEFRSHESGTSHFITVDADGNVVSMTTTVNAPLGSRIVAGDTGVLLNDQLDDFSGPSEASGFGVVGLGPNRPRAGARPVSSMTPTIVLEGGVPLMATGGSGGIRIATGVTQATLARLVFGFDPSVCVSAPRIAVAGAPELVVDSEVAEDVRAGLKARGEQIKDETYSGSAVQMVAWERAAGRVRILAAADPRKGGSAAAQ